MNDDIYDLLENGKYDKLGKIIWKLFNNGETEKAIELSEILYRKQLDEYGERGSLDALVNLAEIYENCGRYEKAMELYHLAEEICGRYDIQNKMFLYTYIKEPLARIYFCFGDYTKAMETQNEVLSKYLNEYGEADTDSVDALNELIMYTVEAGNTEDALLLSEKAESIATENDMGAEMLSKVYSRRARILEYLHRHRDALELYQKAYDLIVREKGEEDDFALENLYDIGGIYYDLGDYEKSLGIKKKLYKLCIKTIGMDNPNTQITRADVGSTYKELMMYDEAFEYIMGAYEWYMENCGTSNDNTQTIMSKLSKAIH